METNKIQELWLGDCLELIKNIPDQSIDLILCDLPYGTTKCKWDSIIDLPSLWSKYKKVIKEDGIILLFAQTPFDKILGVSNLEWLRYEWIWEKTQATGFFNAKKMPMKAHENILVFYKQFSRFFPQKTQGHKPINSYTKYLDTVNKTEVYGKCNKELNGGGETDRFPRSVIKFSSDKQKSHLHPTQKPLALCEYLIQSYSEDGDLILDNCMGSGTTCLAAKNLGRQFIGIEKEEKYFKIAQERLAS